MPASAGDAEETPFGIGDVLDEGFFLVGGGGKFGEVTIEVLLVDDGVVAG